MLVEHILTIGGAIAALASLIKIGVYGASVYAYRTKRRWNPRLLIGFLTWAVFTSVLFAVGQYVVWVSTPALRILTTAPVTVTVATPTTLVPILSLFSFTHGYFVFYIMMHFFAALFLAGAFALFVTLVFVIVRRYRASICTRDELVLLSLSTLTLGWPLGIVLVPLMLVAALFFTLKQRDGTATLSLPIYSAWALLLLWHIAHVLGFPFDLLQLTHVNALVI